MIIFAKKVISCLIITSLVLMDVASCMDEPDLQKQALISTPLRVVPDQTSSTNTSSSHSSDRDSPPHKLVDSSSAPARLHGPHPSTVVVLQPRSSSFSVTRRSDDPSPFPSPNLGRVSSADQLLGGLDPRQALKEQREKQAQLRDRLLDVQPVDEVEAFNALLRHINFIMEGRSTKQQDKAKKKGTAVGIIGSIPNSPVFDAAIFPLDTTYGSSPSAIGFGLSVMGTAILDSVPRNREFYTSEFLLAETSSSPVIKMRQTEEHQRTFSRVSKLTWVISTLATAPLIKLFVATEFQIARYNYNNAAYGWFAYGVVYLGITVIPYMLDGIYFNAIPFLKRAKDYINSSYYQELRNARRDEEGQRNYILTIFRETAHLLAFVSDSERRKICDGFFADLTGSEEDKAVERLKQMIAFHKKHTKLKSILDEDNLINDEKLKVATWTAKGSVVVLFLGQAPLFYLIVDNLFGLLVGDGILRIITKPFSALFGSLGANAATSGNAYGAIKNISLKVFGGKNPLEDDSHPVARTGVTFSTMAVGALRTLPLTVLLTILTNGWSLTPRLLLLTIGSASANVTNAWAFRWYNNLVSAAAWGCRTLGSKIDVVKRVCHTLADEVLLDLNYDHVGKIHKKVTEERPDREERVLLPSLPAPQSFVVSLAPSAESSESNQKKVKEDEHEQKLDGDMKEPSTNTNSSQAQVFSLNSRALMQWKKTKTMLRVYAWLLPKKVRLYQPQESLLPSASCWLWLLCGDWLFLGKLFQELIISFLVHLLTPQEIQLVPFSCLLEGVPSSFFSSTFFLLKKRSKRKQALPKE